jgi:hypothetical protein
MSSEPDNPTSKFGDWKAPAEPARSILEGALTYAAAGLPVFPQNADGSPLTPHGFHDATVDPEQIKRWWTVHPQALIGMPTGAATGIFVVDLDRKEYGKDGVETWRKLTERHGGAPRTWRNRTPSTGEHWLFRHVDGLRNIPLDKLGVGLEVKAEGGAITLPPSRNERGVYFCLSPGAAVAAPPEWLLGLIRDYQTARPAKREPVPLPDWMQPYLEQDVGKGISIDPSDTWPPADRARIEAALAVIDPDIGRAEWIAIGCGIYRALDDEAGFAVWNEWSRRGRKYKRREMERQWRSIVAADGYAYTPGTIFYLANETDPDWWRSIRERKEADDHPGAELEEPEAENPPGAAQEEAESSPRPPTPVPQTKPNGLPQLHWHGEQSTTVEIQWLIKGLLKQEGAALISGQWGTGKTFVALDLAGSVLPDCNQERFIDYRIKRRGGVLFVAAEGAGSIRLRFEAMLAHKLGRSLLLEDNPPQPFVWIDYQAELAKKGARTLIDIAEWAKAELRARFKTELVLIIVDTLAASAGFKDENDAAEAQKVMGRFGELSRSSGAVVVAVDHFGKDVSSGTRGSSAKEGYADSVLSLLGERREDGEVSDLRVVIRKVRDGQTGRVVPFALQVIDCGKDEDGDPVTTCVVRWEPDRPPAPKDKGGRPAVSRHEFNDALSAAMKEHREEIELPDGAKVQAVRLNDVREAFKATQHGSGSADAVSGRFRRELTAARTAGRIRFDEISGIDWVWWPPDNRPI